MADISLIHISVPVMYDTSSKWELDKGKPTIANSCQLPNGSALNKSSHITNTPITSHLVLDLHQYHTGLLSGYRMVICDWIYENRPYWHKK